MKNNYVIRFIVIFALILVFPVTSLASTRAVQITELITGLINPTTGRILDNHTAFFYAAGTSTPKAVWTEKEKTNPYTEYDLSAIGNIQLYGEGNYKIVIEEYAADDSGTIIYTWDNLRFEFPNYYVHSISSNYNHATEDDFLLVDTSGGNVTVSMLSAASFTHPLRIRRVSGSNSIIIDPDGSETINGASTLTWTTDVVIEIVSDGSNLVSVGFSSVMADDDNDTKVQVEESTDEDKIRFDTGGTERIVIDSNGLDIQSGGLLIGGSEKISSSSIISGLNFSQDGYIYITDTGDTTFENPLQVLSPNIDDTGTIRLLVGKDSNTKNYGYIDFYHASDQSASNYAEFGLTGGAYARFTGGNVVTIPAGSNDFVEINPSGALEIVDSGGSPLIDFKTGQAEDYDCRFQQDNNGILIITGGNGSTATTATFDSSNNVGIGKTSGGAKLDVNGEIEGTSLDINGAADISGAITGVTNITTSGEYDGATLDISGNADIDGTTNLDDTDIDGTVDISSTLDIGASTTRRVAPAGTFVNNSNGNPNISDTAIDIDSAITVATWESIGPTGSGADNIWTAMDSVPTDADFVVVKLWMAAYSSSGEGGTLVENYAYVRKTGSSESVNSENRIGYMTSVVTDSGKAAGASIGNHFVPVDGSIRFDLYYTNNFDTPSLSLYLVGWGFNP